MTFFGSGMSAATTAARAAGEAATTATRGVAEGTAKVAFVFASVSYADVAGATGAVRAIVGPGVPILGGTAGGCVFSDGGTSRLGVSVAVVGGKDVEVVTRAVRASATELYEVVPVAEEIARAADAAARRGYVHFTCFVFAPGIFTDGEALAAAVRKGAGARAQLAGGLTGDDFTLDRPGVFVDDELSSTHVVLAGVFTRHPVGIAARHGWRPVGPVRTVTRAEGPYLIELDGRPALDPWLEDARAAGGSPPEEPEGLAVYLANHYDLGIVETPSSRPRERAAEPAEGTPESMPPRELLVRAPFSTRPDGSVQLSATIAEGSQVRVLHATRCDLFQASEKAAETAFARAGGEVAGALVLACTGRLAALGDAFGREPATIHERLGAPIAGACVFGEIARNVRDTDAFFNTTAVVVAFGT